MATGDKLYLADKETLDQVKTNTDLMSSLLDINNNDTATIKQTTNVISSTMNNIKESTDQLVMANSSSASRRDYFTANDVVNKYKAGSISVANTGDMSHIDITGSGEIYAILYTTTSSANTSIINYFTVNVDGLNVYNFNSNSGATVTQGLITRDVLVSGGSSSHASVYVSGGRPISISDKILSNSGLLNHSAMLYLPKPLRFENRLQVRAYLSTTTNLVSNGMIYYMYKLD